MPLAGWVLTERAAATATAQSPPPGSDQRYARIVWTLALGAFGLAFSLTTTAAYLPPLLGKFTDSTTLIALVLAAEGIFAIALPVVIGPWSDTFHTPLGRRGRSCSSRSARSPSASLSWRSCRTCGRPRCSSSRSSSPTTSTSRPTAACTPTCCRSGSTAAPRARSTYCAGSRSAPRSSAAARCSTLWEPSPFLVASVVVDARARGSRAVRARGRGPRPRLRGRAGLPGPQLAHPPPGAARCGGS